MPWRRAWPIAVFVALLVGASARHAAAAEAVPEGGDVPQVVLSIDTVTALPGERVRLTLSVETTVALQSIRVALDFDESSLKVLGVTRLGTVETQAVETAEPVAGAAFDNNDADEGNQLAEGWVFFELGSDSDILTIDVPMGVTTAVLALDFLVLPTATIGFSPVTFSAVGPSGEEGAPPPFDNEAVVVADGGMGLRAQVETLGQGGVKIIGEIGFMRGDANSDRTRDISDPITTLSHLFVGSAYLQCEDAADADDSGALDLTDAVFTLHNLFLVEQPFPAPDLCGRDPTPDGLSCRTYRTTPCPSH